MKSKIMNDKPNILIEKSMDLHPQCNFCLCNENINTIYTDRLAIIISICDECLTKINKQKDE